MLVKTPSGRCILDNVILIFLIIVQQWLIQVTNINVCVVQYQESLNPENVVIKVKMFHLCNKIIVIMTFCFLDF